MTNSYVPTLAYQLIQQFHKQSPKVEQSQVSDQLQSLNDHYTYEEIQQALTFENKQLKKIIQSTYHNNQQISQHIKYKTKMLILQLKQYKLPPKVDRIIQNYLVQVLDQCDDLSPKQPESISRLTQQSRIDDTFHSLSTIQKQNVKPKLQAYESFVKPTVFSVCNQKPIQSQLIYDSKVLSRRKIFGNI